MADAWNARSASASVVLKSDESTANGAPVASVPDNDHFAMPLVIEGKEGSTELDLLRATTEPGEPLSSNIWHGRPSGSVMVSMDSTGKWTDWNSA